MSSQFPSLSHCVHHRTCVKLLCFSRKEAFSQKGDIAVKTGWIIIARHSVCLREGSSEGKEGATAGKCCIYCEKRRNKTESLRKFEHMIKDALDIYRQRYKGERGY